MENLVNPKITEEYVLKIAKEYQLKVREKNKDSSFSVEFPGKCINFKKINKSKMIAMIYQYDRYEGSSYKRNFKFLGEKISGIIFSPVIKGIPTRMFFNFSVDEFIIPHVKVYLMDKIESGWISDKKLFFMFCEMYKTKQILPDVIDYLSEFDNPIGAAIRA